MGDFYCKEFSALPNGCIFSVSNDDAYLIKIQRINAGDKPINAIQLKDGSPLYFDAVTYNSFQLPGTLAYQALLSKGFFK